MNWRLISLGLFVIVLINTFNLGRMSVEFRSTGSDWAVLILSIIVLITSQRGSPSCRMLAGESAIRNAATEIPAAAAPIAAG
jgi:hypothetical protein